MKYNLFLTFSFENIIIYI